MFAQRTGSSTSQDGGEPPISFNQKRSSSSSVLRVEVLGVEAQCKPSMVLSSSSLDRSAAIRLSAASSAVRGGFGISSKGGTGITGMSATSGSWSDADATWPCTSFAVGVVGTVGAYPPKGDATLPTIIGRSYGTDDGCDLSVPFLSRTCYSNISVTDSSPIS